MCTAIKYKGFVGRNLDYDFSFGEEVVITPRNYIFKFKNDSFIKKHYAIIGVAHVEDNYPLYYDAMNEKGLSMLGLNFVGNAVYSSKLSQTKRNIAQFELIPWILSKCANVAEVRKLLKETNITNVPFNDKFPTAQLHYMIADKENCVVLELTKAGLNIYKDPMGVLTNNPLFPMQLFNLNNYSGVVADTPLGRFAKNIPIDDYSRGMSAIGLPGDPSSMSRFVRVTFVLNSSVDDSNTLNQFFHILHSVEQQKGICEVKKNEFEYTIYSSCMDLENLDYYYTTYRSHQINVVHMNNINLENKDLTRFEMVQEDIINNQN